VRATVDDGLLEVTLPTAQVPKISMLAKAASV